MKLTVKLNAISENWKFNVFFSLRAVSIVCKNIHTTEITIANIVMALMLRFKSQRSYCWRSCWFFVFFCCIRIYFFLFVWFHTSDGRTPGDAFRDLRIIIIKINNTYAHNTFRFTASCIVILRFSSECIMTVVLLGRKKDRRRRRHSNKKYKWIRLIASWHQMKEKNSKRRQRNTNANSSHVHG